MKNTTLRCTIYAGRVGRGFLEAACRTFDFNIMHENKRVARKSLPSWSADGVSPTFTLWRLSRTTLVVVSTKQAITSRMLWTEEVSVNSSFHLEFDGKSLSSRRSIRGWEPSSVNYRSIIYHSLIIYGSGDGRKDQQKTFITEIHRERPI
jgi:hypothetical protein